MNVATVRMDGFWPDDNSQSFFAEDFAVLLVVAAILASTYFAIIAPQLKGNIATTIDVRIESAAPSAPQVTEMQATPNSSASPTQPVIEMPEKAFVDPVAPSQSAPQNDPVEPQPEPVDLRAEKSARKLDLSLPPTSARFRQFGVIDRSPGLHAGPERRSRKQGGSESGTPTTTYEPYVSVFGDVEVKVSDRCTMILDSRLSFLNPGDPKIARIKCNKNTGKIDLERLFKDIQHRRAKIPAGSGYDFSR